MTTLLLLKKNRFGNMNLSRVYRSAYKVPKRRDGLNQHTAVLDDIFKLFIFLDEH